MWHGGHTQRQGNFCKSLACDSWMYNTILTTHMSVNTPPTFAAIPHQKHL